MSRVINCGLIEQGLGNLKYHALREDDTAACSSYIRVVRQPFPASSIQQADRCNSPACRKLFAVADKFNERQPTRHGAGVSDE